MVQAGCSDGVGQGGGKDWHFNILRGLPAPLRWLVPAELHGPGDGRRKAKRERLNVEFEGMRRGMPSGSGGKGGGRGEGGVES